MKRLYPIDPALAESLAARRRALRWSQNALALQAGLTEGLVAKLETLRTPISPEHHAAIDAALAHGERQTEDTAATARAER